jgi:hypothetical protein
MTRPQLDLFASHQAARVKHSSPALERPPADFIARIRGELETTLRIAREATTLPWPDLTRATLVELRFHSIARWLPADEATALRGAFEVEMARLYEREEEGATG